MRVTLLDGAIGTELARRGVPTPAPGWSAHAIDHAPGVLRAIHADYARAGADLVTANTWRAQPRAYPDDWQRLVARAVGLARASAPGARIAGSMGPVEDCYRPDLSPAERDPVGTRARHAEQAAAVLAAGVDVIIGETFPHPGEALLALDAMLGARGGGGAPAWVSLTPGYRCELMNAAELAEAGRALALAGAAAVLVNCVPAADAGAYVRALRDRVPAGVEVGVYANAGLGDDSVGPGAYAELAMGWCEAGATIIGGCCGTGPAHIAALTGALGRGLVAGGGVGG